MYGAFWCTHCHDQKEEFGKEAMADFPYVECYPDGVHNVRLRPSPCLRLLLVSSYSVDLPTNSDL